MAERRMFTKKITDSDAFIELSSSTQALYFHLNQGADDDGFNNQVQNAMFKAHASVDDLKVLLMKNFIIRFESGVIVIKHWRMHNTLRKDRYTPTSFQEELSALNIKDNGSYTLIDDGCQVVAKRLPQDSIGKVSKDKVSIGKNSITNTHTAKGGQMSAKCPPDIEPEIELEIEQELEIEDNEEDKIGTKCLIEYRDKSINNNHHQEQNMLVANSNEDTIISKTNYEQEFDNIWELYPNKKGKTKALNKYILARKKGTTYEQVLNGVANYIEYIKKNKISLQYIKHGDTYFNNQCWLDEYKDETNDKSQNDEQWALLKGVYDGTIKIGK